MPSTSQNARAIFNAFECSYREPHFDTKVAPEYFTDKPYTSTGRQTCRASNYQCCLPAPTIRDSKAPSTDPTFSPSVLPTTITLRTPSSDPTHFSSISLTGNASDGPSFQPSVIPTSRPSILSGNRPDGNTFTVTKQGAHRTSVIKTQCRTESISSSIDQSPSKLLPIHQQ
jgi:hypothetical protein